MKDRHATLALALAPGLLGAALGPAVWPGLFLTVFVYVVLARRVVRERAGAPLAQGARGVLDLAAFLVGILALTGTTLLSSPFPPAVSSPTPGRRVALALGACALAASVRIVLARAAGSIH